MNKSFYLLITVLFVSSLSLTSCKETKEVDEYGSDWRVRNEQFMDSLRTAYQAQPVGAGPLMEITPMSKPHDVNYRIYAKAVKGYEGIGEMALYNDTVEVYYRGTLINNKMFDQNFKGTNPDPEINVPLKSLVNSFVQRGGVSGWTDVLQHMRVGDRWVVYFPWQVAYGSAGSLPKIPGYSTLIFDMNLISITAPKGPDIGTKQKEKK
ncbi:MAG: FKBP-type peptidyl-prolyl cis-trans isomerase [Bacteroidaceae bacterium]